MKKLYPEEDVQAIADSIRAKNGSSDTYTIGQMSTAIDALPSGGPVVATENGANFYDYDGTLLYSYPKTDVALMTELPPNPTHAGLTAQGWNWSLASIQSWLADYDGVVNVGQVYVTDDGATRIYVTLDETTLNPRVGVGVNGTIEIDWGDESAYDTVTGTSKTTNIYTSHTYTQPGDYIIRLIPKSGSFDLQGDNTYGSRIFLPTQTAGYADRRYQSCVKKIEFGTNITSISECGLNLLVNLKYITIPSNIVTFGTRLFSSDYSLKCTIIPYETSSLSAYTFFNCFNLFSVASGRSMTVGNYRHCENEALKSVTLPKPTSANRSIGTSAFYNCTNLTSIVVPNGTTSIGNGAFRGTKLTTAYVSTNVKAFPRQAFYNVYPLKGINTPPGTTSFGDASFLGCTSLPKIDFPDGVKSIGSSAFINCYSLQNITIPAATTAIGVGGFANCYGLESIKFKGTTPPTVGTTAFVNLPTNCVIKVPSGTSATYAAADNYPDSSVYTYEEYTTT